MGSVVKPSLFKSPAGRSSLQMHLIFLQHSCMLERHLANYEDGRRFKVRTQK